MGHDQLQAKCFKYVWNTYPELRQLMWHTPNELPLDTSILGVIKKFGHEVVSTVKNHITKQHNIQLSRRSAIGVVKGIVDLVMFNNGKLHTFDIKLGADKLSKEQISFIERVKSNGGTYDTIEDFDSFKTIINEYLRS